MKLGKPSIYAGFSSFYKGSNPSSPVQEANYQYTHLVVGFFYIEINEKQYLNVSGQTPQKMHCIFFQLFFRSFKTFREFKV